MNYESSSESLKTEESASNSLGFLNTLTAMSEGEAVYGLKQKGGLDNRILKSTKFNIDDSKSITNVSIVDKTASLSSVTKTDKLNSTYTPRTMAEVIKMRREAKKRETLEPDDDQNTVKLYNFFLFILLILFRRYLFFKLLFLFVKNSDFQFKVSKNDRTPTKKKYDDITEKTRDEKSNDIEKTSFSNITEKRVMNERKDNGLYFEMLTHEISCNLLFINVNIYKYCQKRFHCKNN